MSADPSTVPAHWGLLDAEAQHRSFPDAFPIPSRAEREALKPGDMVKMVFVLDPPPESGPNAERMWVEVRSASDGLFDGWLTNAPRVIAALELGTFLAFGPEHVAGIALQTDEVAFDIASLAVVSKRVLDRAVPPGWAGHDDPVDDLDSGWTVAAGDEPADHFSGDPAESSRSMTLGELVQRYPSLVEVFQAGSGEWVYRPDHRRYVRLKDQSDAAQTSGHASPAGHHGASGQTVTDLADPSAPELPDPEPEGPEPS